MDYSTLKQQIVDEIRQSPIANINSRALKQMVQNGSANYQDVAEYSKVLGDVTSKTIERSIASGISDEELETFANECLAPIYRQSQDTMLNACKSVQKLYNKQANIDLNPAEVKRDESRIQHIVDRFNEAEKFDEVKFLTNSNVARSITRGAVQDSIRANSKMQSDLGLKIRISRSDGSGCCDWCSSVTGTFDNFDALPDGFWGIHRGCSCVIDYRVGNTRNKLSFKTNEKGNLTKVTEELNDNLYANSDISSKINTNPVKDAIKSKSVSTVINPEKQGKHILNSPNYVEGRSYIYGDVEDAQKIVNQLAGKGEAIYTRTGDWNNKEVVIADKPIGVNVSIDGQEKKETNMATIHYSRTGSHVVPKIKDE